MHFSVTEPTRRTEHSSLDITTNPYASLEEMIGNEDDSGQLDSAPVKSNCVTCGGKCEMSFC